MDTAIVVGLIGAAGTVVASVLSALIYRSRSGSAPPDRPVPAAAVLVGRLDTFRARLAVGLSTIALLVGMSAAGLSRGGWFNKASQAGDSWLNTPLTDLSALSATSCTKVTARRPGCDRFSVRHSPGERNPGSRCRPA